MATEPLYVEARPHAGYVTHAIRNQPEQFYRTAPNIVNTFRRALCGVGRGGMRVTLGRDTGEPIAWMGVDGCDRCHVLHKRIMDQLKARELAEKIEALSTIGTPVLYWPGVRHGEGRPSVTRSEVWELCGTPVVAVEGYAGGIALSHIEIVNDTPEQELADDMERNDHR
ncbi:hypothetical protein SEA_MUFASA8_73 [Arthrobacter phage Mufasa8]|uniref:Uncharacterized protein n=1 Tax=Arthrobacter phage Mufasa8 TaxID=2656526 RepID=A0A649VMR3_9CAUD|nr:hypothetical protein HYQ08_gp073 [Arthrobacter phage Mufasa8]QGJ93521.1 hypothetical protein SEA_MUFASA8_73 [Arthrobacter phage Mufasa8]